MLYSLLQRRECFLFLLVTVSLPIGAVNPGCECVRYTNTWGKEWGVFGSPDYPAAYPRGIKCLLYSFSAPPGFIIQLNLDKVNLPDRQREFGLNSGCFDFLKLFIHVDEVRLGGSGHGGVNEQTPWTSLICGHASNLSFHSSSRHLVIQFHSGQGQPPSRTREPFYFTGRYRFLNSSQFSSTGRLMTGTKCDYQFIGSEEEGRFFSPHYPSTYPYNIKCAYHFYASLHKRVRILFETISLQPGDYSCLNKTDVIRVIDGSNANSPIIGLICNTVKDYEILSSGPHLQVEFLANSDNPGTGFRAIYQYVQVQLDSALDNTRLQLSPDHMSGHDELPQASTLVPQCNQVISSDAGRNGSFSSPNYPHHYSPKAECRYVFIGHGKERVQIRFTDFSLFHPEKVEEEAEGGGNGNGNSYLGEGEAEAQTLLQVQKFLSWNYRGKLGERNRRCLAGADTLSVWTYMDGQLEKLMEFCGHELPPPIMSNGHRLMLEFKGGSNAHFSRGFYATYGFVESFGVKPGRQLADFPCAFMYNSSEISSGIFTSPNYPGIYPQDTECHYFFYGSLDHHVVLTFSYFHVQGRKACQEGDSDYLEFSNYMQSDNNYGRKCGTGLAKKPFRLISDSHFFRVTFRSGKSFLGGGFVANFHFTTQPKEDLIRTHDHASIRLILPGDLGSLRYKDSFGESDYSENAESSGKGGGSVRSGVESMSLSTLGLRLLLSLGFVFQKGLLLL